jgi:hypothetical protein
MTTPTFDNVFSLYYTLYRAEATVPASTEDEYTIALRFANEAVARWATYDNTYWRQLFRTAQTASTGGVVTTTAGTATYAAPTAFKEAGGFIKLKNSAGITVQSIPIIEPQEAQFRGDNSSYAYFTSVAGGAYTLHLNTAPTTSGLLIDYVYYAKPTEFATGSSTTECPNAEMLCHRMLGMRFRASRNPYYQDAIDDAEDALHIMKMDNDSGNWADPWKVADNSGSMFGV